MNFKNLRNKGQGLPLNTIVIAILVIIVLLVIIVFFTNQVGESGDTLEQNSASQCNENNPALATLGYEEYHPMTDDEIEDDDYSCSDKSGDGWKSAPGVSNCCVREESN